MREFKPADTVSCHAWSADSCRLALCPNSNELHIYTLRQEQWAREHVLHHHDRLISSVDWSWSTNRLVTCSHDLNAYVLNFKEGRWHPDMVVTRLRREALCVRWSPCGSKFAAGGTGKEVSVCFTESASGWWGAALIRSHNSAVMGVAWHPSGEALATVCLDGKCRIFNALPKGSAQEGRRAAAFGALLHEMELGGGWGTAISWAPSGAWIAVSSHEAQVTLIKVEPSSDGREKLEPQHLSNGTLPLRSLAFLSDRSLAAAGFDGHPCLFSLEDGGVWAADIHPAGHAGGSREAEPLRERQLASDFSAKLALFRSSPSSKVMRGTGKEKPELHASAIAEIRLIRGGVFSTAGLDGRIKVWETRV